MSQNPAHGMAMEDAEFLKQRRALIDLFAEARSQTVRVAFFGTLLHRPNPDGDDGPGVRARQLELLAETISWIDRLVFLASQHTDPLDEFQAPVCAFLKAALDKDNSVIEHLKAMQRLAQAVLQAAREAPDQLGQALVDHYALRKYGYSEALTGFCDQMWAAVGEERSAEVLAARETSQAVSDALVKMEKIAKHVRLVSLNASVEAARVGEAGAGLGVIAFEFKRLAEEIQDLSKGARVDIGKLADSKTIVGVRKYAAR